MRPEKMSREALMNEIRLLRDRLKLLEGAGQDGLRQSEPVGRAIRNPSHFMNFIFDSIRDPLCIFDHEHRIVNANEAYATITNSTVSGLLGSKCDMLPNSGGRICDSCLIDKTFRSGDPCASERMVTNNEGVDIWYETYTYPMFSERGKVTHVIEYAREITDRKITEHKEKRLIRDLNLLSQTDALTGLLNRRAFLERLSHEMGRSERSGSALSLILCDIDRFKEINDSFGHSTGDNVIKCVAGLLNRGTRKTDIVGRYGGDEFIIVLPDTDMAGAVNLAEELRKSLLQRDRAEKHKMRLNLSLSLGVAEFRPLTESVGTLIDRADAALYLSKNSGRNRVCASDPKSDTAAKSQSDKFP